MGWTPVIKMQIPQEMHPGPQVQKDVWNMTNWLSWCGHAKEGLVGCHIAREATNNESCKGTWRGSTHAQSKFSIYLASV